MKVRDILQDYIRRHQSSSQATLTSEQMSAIILSVGSAQSEVKPEDQIVGLKEYDVPYIMRVSIDLGISSLPFFSVYNLISLLNVFFT